MSLELAVTSLRRGINPLEGDLFKLSSRGLRIDGLSEGNDSLLWTGNLTLQHNKVFINNTIVREASKRGDSLFSDIKVSRSVLLVVSLSNSVDLLVDFGSVVETALTSTWDSSGNTGRMPCSNTGNLSET